MGFLPLWFSQASRFIFFFFNKAHCNSFFFAVWVAGSKKKKRGIKETDGMPCSRACQEVRKF